MAQINHNEVIEDLQKLGLTRYEAEIYFILVKSGEASAGAVLAATGYHREQVYRALKRLVDQGLATTYKKSKRCNKKNNYISQKKWSCFDCSSQCTKF